MRLRIISDLHVDSGAFKYETLDEDLLVIAGDISNGVENSIEWLKKLPKKTQVIAVAGNHEYYNRKNIPHNNLTIKKSLPSNVHCFPHGSKLIGDILFVGHPYWTDFKLYNDPMSPFYWGSYLNDSRMIYRKNRHISYDDFVTMHKAGIRFIRNELKNYADQYRKSVLVTHYFPTQSIHEKYLGDKLNPGFASKWPEDILVGFDYIIHGHTHESMDYMIEDTRVICNPKGYSNLFGETENRSFNPNLIVEI